MRVCSVAWVFLLGAALGCGGCGLGSEADDADHEAARLGDVMDAGLDPGLEEDDADFDDSPLGDVMDAGLDPAVEGVLDPVLDAETDGGRDAGRGTPVRALPCSDLFDSRLLRTYEVQISAAELQKINDEFLHPVVNETDDGYLHPYHPIVLKVGDETRTDAMIRLKGDSSWLETITEDRNPKAQFVIAFDRTKKSARFHGVDKVEFDMPRTDPTYLRERVGHQLMRELGLPGVCAASARITINGRYYGLYVAMEDLSKETLKRIFPDAPGGPLWADGVELKTKATEADITRQQAWQTTEDLPSMQKLIDLEQALRVWAAEIVMNDADGYYGGDHNFYTYDHPTRGFVWLPTDLDSTFDYIEWNVHPIYWWEDHDSEQTAGHHYRAVINDPVWRAKLVEAVAQVLARWNVPRIQRMVDVWALQVARAARQDPHRWSSLLGVRQATTAMRETVRRRPEYLRGWLQCERTNQGTDADGDGAPWCKDCNDKSASARPGAPEICGNALDDNCNGLKDETCPGFKPSQ